MFGSFIAEHGVTLFAPMPEVILANHLRDKTHPIHKADQSTVAIGHAMKRYVPFAGLWFVVAAPLAVSTGCNIEPEMQRCVDYQNQIVSYSLCQFPSKPVRITGSINPVPRYRFYYGGFGGEEVGSTVWGGSEKALAGHVYRPVGVDAEVTRTIKNSPQPYVAGPIH